MPLGCTVPPPGSQVLGGNLNCSESCLGIPPKPNESGLRSRPLHCGISIRSMTAVGHERRFCDVCGTSALPPILTVTADILNRQLRNVEAGPSVRTQSHRHPRDG